MERKTILEKFKKILKPYVQNPEALKNIGEDSKLTEDLEINSAHLVDVFLDAEDEFDIELDNDSLEKIQNTGDAIDVIRQKLKAN